MWHFRELHPAHFCLGCSSSPRAAGTAQLDDLLTGFLEELGVSPETFMEVATKLASNWPATS